MKGGEATFLLVFFKGSKDTVNRLKCDAGTTQEVGRHKVTGQQLGHEKGK